MPSKDLAVSVTRRARQGSIGSTISAGIASFSRRWGEVGMWQGISRMQEKGKRTQESKSDPEQLKPRIT